MAGMLGNRSLIYLSRERDCDCAKAPSFMDTSDYDLILPGDQLGHHLWI